VWPGAASPPPARGGGRGGGGPPRGGGGAPPPDAGTAPQLAVQLTAGTAVEPLVVPVNPKLVLAPLATVPL